MKPLRQLEGYLLQLLPPLPGIWYCDAVRHVIVPDLYGQEQLPKRRIKCLFSLPSRFAFNFDQSCTLPRMLGYNIDWTEQFVSPNNHSQAT